MYGLKAAIELLLEVGIATVEARVLGLTAALMAGLEARGYRVVTPKADSSRAGIVIFESPRQSPAEIDVLLRNERIITAERGSGTRVSPHFYNTELEIARLLEVLPVL